MVVWHNCFNVTCTWHPRMGDRFPETTSWRYHRWIIVEMEGDNLLVYSNELIKSSHMLLDWEDAFTGSRQQGYIYMVFYKDKVISADDLITAVAVWCTDVTQWAGLSRVSRWWTSRQSKLLTKITLFNLHVYIMYNKVWLVSTKCANTCMCITVSNNDNLHHSLHTQSVVASESACVVLCIWLCEENTLPYGNNCLAKTNGSYDLIYTKQYPPCSWVQLSWCP